MSTNTQVNPNTALIVIAALAVLMLAGGIYLLTNGQSSVGSMMIGAVVTSFFIHAHYQASATNQITAAEATAHQVLNAVASGAATASSGDSSSASTTSSGTSSSTKTTTPYKGS